MSDLRSRARTRFHSDHTVGIPDIWLTGWLESHFGTRTKPFRVIGPVGTQTLMRHLEQAYAADIDIRRADEQLGPQGIRVDVDEFQKDGVVYDVDGLRIIAFEVDHGDLVKPAFGYRIEYRNRVAVISGDTRYNANVIKYGAGADLLIHEVAMVRPELAEEPYIQRIMAHHTTPEDVGRVFASTRPKLAAFTHIVFLASRQVPPASLTELVAATRTTYSGPLEVGEDLTTFEIGDSVNVVRALRSSS